MALPFSFSSELKWSVRIGGNHGLTEYSGSYYTVLVDATGNHAEVWKTTDGTTGEAWAEQDSGNHPSVSSTASNKSVDAVVFGTKLYISYPDNALASIRVHPFDLATNTWGTATTTSGSPISGGSIHISSQGFFRLAVLADGDYIILFQGSTSNMGTAYRTVRYVRYSSSAWGTPTTIADKSASSKHCDGYALIRTSATRCHFLYNNTTDSDLHSRAYDSGSLQTEQTIDDTVTTGNWVVGEAIFLDGELVVPYVDSDGSLAIRRAVNATNPTWPTASEVVSPTTTSDPEFTNANAAAVVGVGSILHAYWGDDTTQDLYRDNDAAGGGEWGTDSEYKDAITLQGINLASLTGAIGVLYNDGGTVKFDKVTTGGFPAVLPGTYSVFRNAVHGPYFDGSNIYYAAIRKLAAVYTASIYKSTDSGATWVRKDVANDPVLNTTATSLSLSVRYLSGKIYVGYLAPTTNQLTIKPFTCSSDTWGTATAGTGTTTQVLHESGQNAFAIEVLADGDYVAAYQYDDGANNLIVLRRYSGGAWGSEATIFTGNGSLDSIIRSSATRVHFVYFSETADDLFTRGWTTAAGLRTEQTVDATLIATGAYRSGIPLLNSGELLVPFVDSDGGLDIGRATDADNPTWATTSVSATATTDPEYTTANPGVILYGDGKVWIFWFDDTDLDIYRDNDAGTNTWGTDTEWKDAVTGAGINGIVSSDVAYIIYLDNTVIKLDTYTMGTPVAGQPIIIRYNGSTNRLGVRGFGRGW